MDGNGREWEGVGVWVGGSGIVMGGSGSYLHGKIKLTKMKSEFTLYTKLYG